MLGEGPSSTTVLIASPATKVSLRNPISLAPSSSSDNSWKAFESRLRSSVDDNPVM